MFSICQVSSARVQLNYVSGLLLIVFNTLCHSLFLRTKAATAFSAS